MTDIREHYERLRALAEERIVLFETGILATGDVEPPRRDTTEESILAERQLVAAYDRALQTFCV